MDQKARIWKAIGVLGDAIERGADEVDDSAMGPLGLTKALLKDLPVRELLLLPGFAGSWLHMLSATVQGVPVGDQLILAGLLPPASMLAPQAKTEEDRQILAVGSTACIRPPQSDLLVLSPATADASVYELTASGMTRIAGSVAELVEREVDVAVGRALGKQLPHYGFDGQNWCVLVAGRRVAAPKTPGDVKRVAASVRAFAEKSGLPLAYVHMGSPIGTDEDNQTFGGVVGWVLAHACARAATPVDRMALDARAAEKIPAEFFEVLAAEHGIVFQQSDEVVLAPAGWSGASLHEADEDRPAEEPLMQTWAEDTTPGKAVDLAALPERFWLMAQYA